MLGSSIGSGRGFDSGLPRFRARCSAGDGSAASRTCIAASPSRPEPRIRCSSTVSAWSSAVWPRAIVPAPRSAATDSRNAWRSSRAASSVAARGVWRRLTKGTPAGRKARPLPGHPRRSPAGEAVVEVGGGQLSFNLGAALVRACKRAVESGPPDTATTTTGFWGQHVVGPTGTQNRLHQVAAGHIFQYWGSRSGLRYTPSPRGGVAQW